MFFTSKKHNLLVLKHDLYMIILSNSLQTSHFVNYCPKRKKNNIHLQKASKEELHVHFNEENMCR